MAQTLQLSEALYLALARQVDHLGLTPEQLLARLLAPDGADLFDLPGGDEAAPPPADPAAALAAVERLTGLFADLRGPDLAAILDDPMLALGSSAAG